MRSWLSYDKVLREYTLFKKTVLNFPTGFCMDLLNRLADKVNFTFEVHLSEDGSYGSLRRVSNALIIHT